MLPWVSPKSVPWDTHGRVIWINPIRNTHYFNAIADVWSLTTLRVWPGPLGKVIPSAFDNTGPTCGQVSHSNWSKLLLNMPLAYTWPWQFGSIMWWSWSVHQMEWGGWSQKLKDCHCDTDSTSGWSWTRAAKRSASCICNLAMRGWFNIYPPHGPINITAPFPVTLRARS